MRYLALLASILLLAACATSTPAPTSTPDPTPVPFDEAFLKAVQKQVNINDTIPYREDTVIALLVNRPGYAFTDGHGIILQFGVPLVPDNEPTLKKTAVLLMGTGLIVAGREQMPLDGVEVVFYTQEEEPWLALALAPPWDMEGDLRLAPLHPDYIRRLVEAGLITPTPAY